MERPRSGTRWFATALTAAVLLGATLTVWHQLRERQHRVVVAQFRLDAQDRISAISRQAASDIEALEAVAAFYAGSQEVDGSEFRQFTTPLLTRRESILALQWAPRVRDADRGAYEARVRAKVHPGFEIRAWDESGGLIRSPQRDTYVPIEFIEPTEPYRAVLGYDHASEPVRQAAMRLAMEKGEVRATEPITLVTKRATTGAERAVILFMPIYENGRRTDTAVERDEYLTGYAVAVVRVEDMLDAAMSYLNTASIDVAIIDSEAPEANQLIHARLGAAQEPTTRVSANGRTSPVTHDASFDFAGRPWLIRCTATPEYLAEHATWMPLVALLSGLVFTVMFSGMIWTLMGRAAAIEALVDQRTSELKHVNEMLENQIDQSIVLEDELLRKTSEFQQIFDSSPSMIWFKSTQGRFILVNTAAARVAGREIHEIIGRTDYDIYPKYADRYIADDRQVIESGEPKLGIEEPHVLPSGDSLWLRTDKVPLRGDEGNVIGLIIVATDITERVKAEQAMRDADERLNLALRSSGVGTWSWDVIKNHIVWDDYIHALFGLAPGTFPGTYEAFAERVHPDDRQRVAQQVYQSMEDDTEFNTEYRVIWPDGTERVIAARGRVYRDGVGQPIRMTGVCFDVTEAQVAEQALRDSEQRFRQLAEHISEVFWITTADGGHILYVSPAFETIWGRPVRDLLDDPRTWVRSMHKDDRRRVITRFREGVRKGQFDEEYRIVRPDGSVRWIRDRGFPVRDEEGTVCRIAGIAQDITDRKRAAEVLARQAERLVQANEELRRSNEELDSFAYIASHDLKEPLRGLSNYATFLLEDYGQKLDGQGKEYLASLTRLCKRMDALIDSLLYYSRVGRTQLAVDDVDLNATLRDVLDRLGPSLAQRGVTVRIPRPLPTVRCDTVRVGEVFANLITNAAKYNDKADKWIEVGYIDPHEDPPAPMGPLTPPLTPDAIVFYVRDNGIGIPSDRQEDVFEMFRRLHSRDEFGGGTGAGLTIVQKIVRRHGGNIWLESVEGEGTTFYFTLTGSPDAASASTPDNV